MGLSPAPTATENHHEPQWHIKEVEKEQILVDNMREMTKYRKRETEKWVKGRKVDCGGDQTRRMKQKL